MSDVIKLKGSALDASAVQLVAVGGAEVALDAGALTRVARNRDALDEAIGRGDRIYGVTTGLGAFVNRQVSPDDAAALQRDVLRSHAAGTGSLLPAECVRAALVVRLNCLLAGRSGIRPGVLERLAELLNRGLTPAVPRTGSVGASGDLAPSAHAFLPLIGEGCFLGPNGDAVPVADHPDHGLEPLELRPKEALALVNGTQFMAGIGALCAVRSADLIVAADAVGALTIEAMCGAAAAYDARVQELRPLPGQGRSASIVRSMIAGSQLIDSAGTIQDAYSLRCIPQVHGATREALSFFDRLVDIDLNAVTDNPIVFDDPLDVVSAGNFHGQSLAIAFDSLRISLATLATISERRTFRLLSPSLNQDLPDFLVAEPGRQNGYMVAQITAAALIAELRSLANQVSANTVPTSDNQEDHVSFGMTAALLALDTLDRCEKVIAIEALCACQALDFRDGAPGAGSRALHHLIRHHVPHLDADRSVSSEIDLVQVLIASGELARLALDYQEQMK
jgi:histidine ammonia-lyase